jgi:formate-dependent nitrite reductase membrane component NrfD
MSGDVPSTSRSRRAASTNEVAAGDQVRTYYNRPVIKEPVWTWEIPVYFFCGGMAGAAATLATVARAAGNERLADAAGTIALGGALASPPLLIADLGRPDRFHHMLRVFKPTSPMSVGSWILAAFAPAAGGAAALRMLGWLPHTQRVLEAVGAVLGPALSTYTAVLVANTAVPVWHDARTELPMVFAGGSAASAGAAAMLLVPPEQAGPARRLAVLGVMTEVLASARMKRHLGTLAEPYHRGRSGMLSKAATGLSATGAALIGVMGRRKSAAVAGAALTLAGAATERWAVFKAGFVSAADPTSTVQPQRNRLGNASRTTV